MFLFFMCVFFRMGNVFEGGVAGGEKAFALRRELGDLERAEQSLDDLIQSSTTQLKQLTEFKDSQRYPFHKAPSCLSYVSSHTRTHLLLLLLPLTHRCTLGYVTYQDIRSIGSLRDQTVIAVKAPAETKLEVPDTAGVRLNMRL